ncbi:hypothetical protein ACJX0J_033547, partial [Zea mays]
VHHRFYSAYDNTTLLYEIQKSIKWARKTYENLPVNVVGHSIGGDLASFCALGLFSIDGNVVARNEIVCDDSGEDPTYS